MADIRPFRRQKRLKSLDEFDGARLSFFTLPKSQPLPIVVMFGGLVLGALIGWAIVGQLQ